MLHPPRFDSPLIFFPPLKNPSHVPTNVAFGLVAAAIRVRFSKLHIRLTNYSQIPPPCRITRNMNGGETGTPLLSKLRTRLFFAYMHQNGVIYRRTDPPEYTLRIHSFRDFTRKLFEL